MITRRSFLARWLSAAAMVSVSRSGWTAEPFTFVQLCDTQLGMGGYEDDCEAFRLAVKQINAAKSDFVVICGDLVNHGHDDKAWEDFKAIKAGFEMPCYCVPGNHDVSNEPTPETLARYRKIMGKDYYSVEHKSFTLVMVNTQLWKAPVSGETEKQDAWLKETLEAASAKGSPVLMFGHYPLFEGTADEEEAYFNLSVNKRAELLELFKKHGVRVYLTGHAHKNFLSVHEGIQLVSSATTSKNFDGAPRGYRVWRIAGGGPFAHEYVAVEGAASPQPEEE